MSRARRVAVVISVLALVFGWAFLQVMTLRSTPESQPFVETVSFALSTPAGLVFLTYLTGVFDFDRYYGERSGAALFGDFFLAVLTAAAVGIPATAVIVDLTDARQVLFVGASFATFVGGFGLFYWRTSEFFSWDASDEE